jgi:hypothetical protein
MAVQKGAEKIPQEKFKNFERLFKHLDFEVFFLPSRNPR